MELTGARTAPFTRKFSMGGARVRVLSNDLLAREHSEERDSDSTMARRKQAHTQAPPGKRVMVVLKNGERFIDKFLRKEKHTCIFAEHTIKTADMKSMTIYRMPPHEQAG